MIEFRKKTTTSPTLSILYSLFFFAIVMTGCEKKPSEPNPQQVAILGTWQGTLPSKPMLLIYTILRPDTTFTLRTINKENLSDTTFTSNGIYNRSADTLYLIIKYHAMKNDTNTNANLPVSIPIAISQDPVEGTIWTVPPMCLLPVAKMILKDSQINPEVILKEIPSIEMRKL